MGKSLYDILDLEEDATANRIKSAYTSLKLRYEQMLPESDPQHISLIQYRAIEESYLILSDPRRRDLYDQKLINNRQASYAMADAHASPAHTKLIFALLFVLAAAAGYTYYQKDRAEKAREQREQIRLELEKEQALLKQEEVRLEAENARLEQERIKQARYDEAKRERDLRQSQYESRQYAADVRRQQEDERRQLQAMERSRPRPTGPTTVRY